MKTKYLILLLIVLPVFVHAQRRKTRVDSLEIRAYVEILDNNITRFLGYKIIDNKLRSSGIGDTAIATRALKEGAVTSTIIEDGTIVLSDLSDAAKSYVGGDVTNNPDDVTIKASGENLYVANPFGNLDTLTQNSVTPSIAGGPSFRTNNTSLTTITSFTNTPGSSIPQWGHIYVMDDSTQFQHGATFDCGGVTLAPDSSDVMSYDWDGHMVFIRFSQIKN